MSKIEDRMNRFRNIRGAGFNIPGALIILTAILFSTIYSREQTHIWFNGFHSESLDAVMKGWTFLGDGTVALIIVLLFLLIRLRYFFILFASYAISGITAQLFKRTLFNGMPRPTKYFELNNLDYDLYLVPGVEIHSWHSFPSGHTATAFGVFFGISLILKSRALQFICLILAIGVGYSRIYLSEHFLMDVTAGAIIGILSAYLSYWWMNRYNKIWMDQAIYKLFKR